MRTIVTMEDTKLEQKLFRKPGSGAVFVRGGGGSLRTAMLGDVNADILKQNGWFGIVINGVVRDSAALRKVNIGVKSVGVTPVRSAKSGIVPACPHFSTTLGKEIHSRSFDLIDLDDRSRNCWKPSRTAKAERSI